MSVYFWISSSLRYLTFLFCSGVLIRPKVTIKNVVIGLVVVATQVALLWAQIAFIPADIFRSSFWGMPGLSIWALTLFALYKYSKDFLYSCYCWTLAMVGASTAFTAMVFFELMWLRVFSPFSMWATYLLEGLYVLLQILAVIGIKKISTNLPFFTNNRAFMRFFIVLVVSFTFVQGFVIPHPNTPDGSWYDYVVLKMLFFLAVVLLSFWQLQVFHKKEMVENQAQYVSEVEAQHLAIRSFRHDYINLLLTMDQYLKEGDLTGLKQYFDEEVMQTRAQLENQNIELGNLRLLKNKEIKSLLGIKLMEARSFGINTIVEVPKVVEEVNVKSTSLARILGSFLDNAIESCKEEETPRLKIAILEKTEEQLIVVKNTCSDKMPTVKQMFEKGFSTKEGSQGLGLYNVRQLLEKENHVTLTTVISDGYCTQELRIKLEV